MTVSYYTHTLNFQGSISDLLKKLTDLTGLVYLQDQSSPVIAFLPESYWLVEDTTLSFWTAQSDTTYNCQEQYSYTPSLAIEKISQWQQFHSHTQTAQHLENGFHGGYIGFVSYDDATQQFIDIQKKSQPSTFIGCYRHFIRIENQQFILYSVDCTLSQHQQIVDIIQYNLQQTANYTAFQLQHNCIARWSKEQYQHAFQKVQEYIVAGDCYQINLTQEFQSLATGLLLDAGETLWQKTQAPFAGYFKHHTFELLSCSPELFIEWQTATQIKTRPIKGTLPRHSDPILDEQNRQKLQHSPKDQAENVMIVDLLRNDFSLYAETGSVKTTKLFEVESFNQVHHLVSEIHAILKQDIHPWQVLMQALPGGSITGAPKIRAMQIIDELEQQARGVYCGSLGYFNFNATGRWNILIRTIQKQEQQLSVWAGGGITIASQLDSEYQECFDKIQAILTILNHFHNN